MHRLASLVLVAALPLAIGCKLLDKKDDKAGQVGVTESPNQPGTPTTNKNAPPSVGCALPDNGSIKADLTLEKGCSIVAKTSLRVNENATLTIEAGVTLKMQSGHYISVDKGKLVAKGTAEAPVVFTSANATQAPGDWVGLIFDDDVNAGTSLDFVRIEFAGAKAAGGKGALSLRSQRSADRVSITSSIIENSDQAGIAADSDKGHFAKFENNKLRKNPRSISAPAEILGSIGAGNVFTDPLSTFGTVDEATTWPAFDAPVFVERSIFVAGKSTAATLTIAPKTTLKFAGGTYLDVGGGSGGSLVAPNVTFTSANATPQPGDWAGIHLQQRATNVDLSGATVEYAGKGRGARAGLNVQGKASDLAGLKASGMRFRQNLGGGIHTSDGLCTTFAGATSEGGPVCAPKS